MKSTIFVFLVLLSELSFAKVSCEISHNYDSENKSVVIYVERSVCKPSNKEILNQLEAWIKANPKNEIKRYLFSGSTILSQCLEGEMPRYGEWKIQIGENSFWDVRKYASQLLLDHCVIKYFPKIKGKSPINVSLEKEVLLSTSNDKIYGLGKYKKPPDNAYLSDARVLVIYE